jgi:hypothetical protein
MNRAASIAVLAVFATGTAAKANLPASDEQVLCTASYVFIGRALTATNENVGKDTTSWPRFSDFNVINLSVRVHRVIGVAARGSDAAPARDLRSGDVIEGVARPSVWPARVAKFAQGRLVFDAPWRTVLPNEVVGPAFTGEDFLYSLRMSAADVKLSRMLIWPVDRIGWAVRTMQKVANRDGDPLPPDVRPIKTCPIAQ